MTDKDLHNMIQTIISLTISKMSRADMIDFIGDRLENELHKWSEKSVVEHYRDCWPEHFKNFEFEEQA